MKRFAVFAAGAAVVICSLASSAFARPWKFVQPWTMPRESHQSRVLDCTSFAPVPGTQVALDDWQCGASGPIVAVRWWGAVLNPQQLVQPATGGRRYQVRIWNHDPAMCRPGTVVLYTACVKPSFALEGTDCEGNPVYRFRAALPAPYFNQVVGNRYWLQISEIDNTSAIIGADDWRWSAHRPNDLCYAVQRNAGFGVTQPLLDACDGQFNDLAFGVYSRSVIIILPPAVMDLMGSARTAQVDLLSPDGTVVRERVSVGVDHDGTILFDPDTRDDDYLVVVRVPGALPMVGPLRLVDGDVAQVDLSREVIGDLDGDGCVGLSDIAKVIEFWDRCAN